MLSDSNIPIRVSLRSQVKLILIPPLLNEGGLHVAKELGCTLTFNIFQDKWQARRAMDRNRAKLQRALATGEEK